VCGAGGVIEVRWKPLNFLNQCDRTGTSPSGIIKCQRFHFRTIMGFLVAFPDIKPGNVASVEEACDDGANVALVRAE